jgi:nucleoside-diphosphate-sugar epimerase
MLARDYEVHAVSSLNGDQPQLRGVRWYRRNLLDFGDIAHLAASVAPSHLLHFAWLATPGEYQNSEENFRWCQAGIELLRQFAAAGGRRAVFAGTCFEYDCGYGYCSENLTPCIPATRYGATKLALAQLVTRFPPAGISTAWGRIFHLYGPHEHRQRLAPSVILALLKGERARCTHGRQVRDFLHVEDVASAFAAILDSDAEGIVNIGSGEPIALRKIVTAIGENLDAPNRIDFGALPAPAHDPRILIPDVRRLHDELGWTPRHSITTGIAATIQWWRDEGVNRKAG